MKILSDGQWCAAAEVFQYMGLLEPSEVSLDAPAQVIERLEQLRWIRLSIVERGRQHFSCARPERGGD